MTLTEPKATVYVQIYDDRPREQKQALADSIHQACLDAVDGLKSENVSIRFWRINRDDIAIGGRLLST